MSRTIPLFPLPGVVLFPGTLLPLHIFEPRYRTLVAHALETDRTIGMAMIAPDRPELGADRPPVREIGGAGKIVEHEMLEDGRYNIILEGAFRFRILHEDASRVYRVARVEEDPATPFPTPAEEALVVGEIRELFAALQPELDLPPLPSEDLSAERLTGELALRLRWPPPALQEVLETNALRERFRSIAARLTEWKEAADFLRPYRGAEQGSLTN